MPGANCAFPNCGANRREAYTDLCIFAVTNRPGDFYVQWRKDILNVLLKYRDDKSLKDRLKRGKIYVCERHFTCDDLEFTKTGRKTLKLGAVPSQNFPQKSHDKQPTERRHLNIVQENTPVTSCAENSCIYKSFKEFLDRISKVKLSDWIITVTENQASLKFFMKPYLSPKYELIINESLEFTCAVYASLLPDDHKLYTSYKRSVRNVTVSNLVKEILKFNVCCGLPNAIPGTNSHSVPCELDLEKPSQFKTFFRSVHCHLLCESDICVSCTSHASKIRKDSVRLNKKINTPASMYAPLSKTNENRLRLALKVEREKCASLSVALAQIKKELQTNSVTLDNELAGDIENTLRIQRTLTPIFKRNSTGGRKKKPAWQEVFDEPLKKRKKNY